MHSATPSCCPPLSMTRCGTPADRTALAGYERARDEAVMPTYQFTCDLAKLAPPPPPMQKLFASLRGNAVESGRFMGTIAGTVPIAEFFALENIERLTRAS